MTKEVRMTVGGSEVCFAANGTVARVMLSSKNGKKLPLYVSMTEAEKNALTAWVVALISQIATAGYYNVNGKILSYAEQRALVEDVCDSLLGKKARADSLCESCIDRFTCNQYCNCVTLERSVH